MVPCGEIVEIITWSNDGKLHHFWKVTNLQGSHMLYRSNGQWIIKIDDQDLGGLVRCMTISLGDWTSESDGVLVNPTK